MKMKSISEIIGILHDYKESSSQKYGIKRMGIFGSVARDEQREDSDLDVFIEVQHPDPYILGDIQEDLEHLTGYKIDLLRLRDNLNKLLIQIFPGSASFVCVIIFHIIMMESMLKLCLK